MKTLGRKSSSFVHGLTSLNPENQKTISEPLKHKSRNVDSTKMINDDSIIKLEDY